MTPEKQNKNPELQSVISPLEERPSESRDTSMLASTLQATIDNLEEVAKKAKGEKAKELNKKLKDAQSWKNRLVKAGKSIIDAENKIREREKKGAHQLTDRGIEAQGKVIEKAQLEINNINKKLIILLKSFDETVGLKSDIEERKKLITLLSGSKNKGLPKDKQNLDFNILSIEELRALETGINAKEGLAKTIETGIDFLPFSERVIDVASTSITKLNELVAKIEANKKTFEKFKAIDVFSSLAEKSLFVYFYKYLENKAKPAIETLVKVFNDVKKKAEEYRLAQEKVLAETKKITEIEARIAKKQGQHFEMPSFETMSALAKERNDSMLKSDFLEIFAKLLNDPATEIKKYLASFDEAIEDQKTSLVRLTMNEVAVVGQELLLDGYADLDKLSTSYNVECRVTEEFPGRDTSRLKALSEQLKAKQAALLATNIGLLTKMIANLKFDEWLLGKTYGKMVALASSPEEKRNLFVEFESMKAGIKTRIDSFLDQITDISFALKTAKDEEKLRAELASGKELGPGSKAFAKRKADFLGKKLKRLDEDFALADSNDDIKRLGVIDDQRIALSFEKKVLEGKFSFEESLDIYWKLHATNPGLAENVKFYLESLGLKEMQKNIFEDVDKGAVRFENDFASYFGGFPGKAIINGTINVEYLESVKPRAKELIDTLELNGYFLSDFKKARTSIDKVLKKLEGAGLENSSLYTSLTRASELYLNLERRYASTNDSDTYKFLNFVVKDASPETDLFKPASWKYAFETFVKIAVPIIIGATIAAVLVIALGPASIPAYILGAAGGAVGQEAFKPLVGLESDWSPGNLALNFATSAASSFALVKGAGVLLKSLSKAAKFGRLGRVGRTVLKLAGKAANPASLRSPVANLAHQLVSEPVEEVEEEFAQQLHPALGALASFMHSGGGVNLDTSNLSVEAARVVSAFKASDATFLTSTDTSAILEFSAGKGKADALLSHLKTLDGKITTNTNGSIVFAFKASPSSTSKVTLEFRPSNESSAVRNLMGSDMGLALQTDFGMALNQDGSYAYDKGKTKTLKGTLENNGFVVQVTGDVVIAQKGDMQLTFKPKSLISGTNISTMENTRLQTVEAAEPERMAEIRAGSTMGSQTVSLLRADVADLWAGMKTTLETTGRAPDAMAKADAQISAQIKTALDNRKLPADFLDGISPAEQLQVLSEVSAMQAESDATGLSVTGEDMELISWDEQTLEEQQMTENVPPEQRLKLLNSDNPDLFMSVLENNTDGLGAYRFALLIAGQSVTPSFSRDQVIKINGADSQLAEFVVGKMSETNPEAFIKLRQEFSEKIVDELGGETAFRNLLVDLTQNFSEAALVKAEAAVGKAGIAITTLMTLFAPSEARASILEWPIPDDTVFIGDTPISAFINWGTAVIIVASIYKIGKFVGVNPFSLALKGAGAGGKALFSFGRGRLASARDVAATRNRVARDFPLPTPPATEFQIPDVPVAVDTRIGTDALGNPTLRDHRAVITRDFPTIRDNLNRILSGGNFVISDAILRSTEFGEVVAAFVNFSRDINSRDLNTATRVYNELAVALSNPANAAAINALLHPTTGTALPSGRTRIGLYIAIALAVASGATWALWPEKKKEEKQSEGDKVAAKASKEEDEKTATADEKNAEDALKVASPQIPKDEDFKKANSKAEGKDKISATARVAGSEYVGIAKELISKLSAKGMTDEASELEKAIHRLKVLQYKEEDASVKTSGDREADIDKAVKQLKNLINDYELKLIKSDAPASPKKVEKEEEVEVKGKKGDKPESEVKSGAKSDVDKAMEAARKKDEDKNKK